jgi:hypothetical protein
VVYTRYGQVRDRGGSDLTVKYATVGAQI